MKRDRRTKQQTIHSYYEEGSGVRVVVMVSGNGSFESVGSLHMMYRETHLNKYTKKRLIRQNDRSWIHHNIPSSIWWYTETHHDWKNGGRMYLLTKAEHILRHRREK